MSEIILLSSEYIVTDKTGKLSEIAKEANNLYNASLYQVRQAFLKRRTVLTYGQLDSMFKRKYQQREKYVVSQIGLRSVSATDFKRS